MIYLDYNATTPIIPAAQKAMFEAFACLGNPSSVHHHGRETRKLLESAREKVATYFGLPARNVTFTSGATEANNLILKGFKGIVLNSAVEHDSVLNVRSDAITVPVNEDGIINLEALEKLLKANDESLVCVLAVNNETGVVQPIAEILQICQKYNSHLHVDAAQAVGKITLNWQDLPSFTISAHKFGGPQGIGAIIINKPLTLSSLIKGGGQERGLRAGTENIIGAVGMGAAFGFDFSTLKPLQEKLENGILNSCPQAIIFGKSSERVTNTTNVFMPNVSSEVQLMHFDLNKISISSGAACSSGKVKTSHVLRAMGIPEETAKCAVRISTGWNTTESDVNQCIAVWTDLFNSQHFKKGIF
ncbi:MAG: cysteine desulfurase family protein [Proteobacteria bacterium]|nr:cysteine desulfurase family protein [Pseudomonadota bacterium]